MKLYKMYMMTYYEIEAESLDEAFRKLKKGLTNQPFCVNI